VAGLIASPLTDSMLRSLEPLTGELPIHFLLSDSEYRRVADWIADWPAIDLLAMQRHNTAPFVIWSSCGSFRDSADSRWYRTTSRM